MKNNNAKENDVESGYWLYDDGVSHWGIPLIRFGVEPFKVDKSVHIQMITEKQCIFSNLYEEKRQKEAMEKAKEK